MYANFVWCDKCERWTTHINAENTEKMSLSDDFQNNNEDGPGVDETERSITIEGQQPYQDAVLLSLSVVNGRFKCSSLTQVQNAIDGNAAGVIFTNIFRIQSRTVGYNYMQTPVESQYAQVQRRQRRFTWCNEYYY